MLATCQFAIMKLRMGVLAIGILAGIWMWQETHSNSAKSSMREHANASLVSPNLAALEDGSGPVRTKVVNRESDSIRFTHSPERLREFMLPALDIEEMSLEAALGKLKMAYDDACRKSGETPLPLTFAIATGEDRKLTVHLPVGSFKSSVQLLATLSGMKVSRKGTAYQFSPIENEQKTVHRNLEVPPNFQTALNEIAGRDDKSSDPFAEPKPEDRVSIQENLEGLGLISPSTRVTLAANGELSMVSQNSVDAEVLSDLARNLADQVPIQVKNETKIVEIPSGSDWTPPENPNLTSAGMDAVMRGLAQTTGAELATFPSITARYGQDANIEIVRELIYPTDDSNTEFESRNIGKVLKIHTNPVAFGNEVGYHFTDTAVESMGTAVLEPIIRTRTEMLESNYMDDAGTRMVVQTREDGSRTVLFIKTLKIDATGRPIE
jgi:hypothetical protein